MKGLIIIPCIAIALWCDYNVLLNTDLLSSNVDALASESAAKFPAGICYGAGPGFSDVSCPGGDVICCWAHFDTFGAPAN